MDGENLILVDTLDKYKDVCEKMQSAKVIYADCESTGLDPYTCIILILSLRFDGETYVIDFTKIPVELMQWLRPALENPNILKVLHNAIFDYKFLWHHAGINVGPMHCTQVTEQLLKAGLHGVSVSLAQVVIRRLGDSLDKSVRDGFIGKTDGKISETEFEYAGKDVDVLEPILEQQMREIDTENLRRVYNLEMNLLSITAKMEYAGIDIDRAKLEEAIPAFEKLIVDADRSIQDAVINAGLASQIVIGRDGYTAINTASQPQMLRLFQTVVDKDITTLGVKDLTEWDAKWALGKKGNLDLGEEFIQRISNDDEDDDLNIGYHHPFLRKHAIRTAASKIHGTYLIGMLDKINPVTKRIHPGFRQCGAMATGRYSSSSPNFQNMPNSGKIANLGLPQYDIRSMFISGPGHKFIISDYSAIELVILAALSKDPILLDQIQNGDVHSFVGNTLFGTNFTKAMADDEPYKTYRHSAKTLTYAIMYGTGGRNLYRTLSLPLATCGFIMKPEMGDQWIADWKGMFPDTGKLLDETGLQAVTRYYTESVLGRRRHWTPDMFRDKWAMYRAMREGTNARIQSSSADMTKLAELLLSNELDPKEAELVATIHDELLTRVVDHKVDKYIPVIKWAMEKAGDILFPDLPKGMISVKPKMSDKYDK